MLSRIAKLPIKIPQGVEVNISGQQLKVKGSLGTLEFTFNDAIVLEKKDDTIVIATCEESKFAKAMSGTAAAIVKNMITGVTAGFEKKLSLVGVGYRAAMKGTDLNLSIGYSHPVIVKAPQGVTFATPTQTEIVVKGIDKQLVGQMAAVVRSHRPVEPYKGKGVRYTDERVSLKEAKKK